MSLKNPTVSALQYAALSGFIDEWREGDLLWDIGPKLNCSEAEALADLLKAFDEPQAAKNLLDGHCLSDDKGDRHWRRRERLEKEMHERDTKIQLARDRVEPPKTGKV